MTTHKNTPEQQYHRLSHNGVTNLELVSDVCSVASENQAKTWTPSNFQVGDNL